MRKTASILTGLLWIILWIIEGFLLLRLILRLAGANPTTPIADFVYSSTDVLLQPFRGLFPAEEIRPGFFLEFSTLFAMVVYALVIFLVIEIIRWASRLGREPSTTPQSPAKQQKRMQSRYDEHGNQITPPRFTPRSKNDAK